MKDINFTTKLALEGILQTASLGLVILQQLPLAEVYLESLWHFANDDLEKITQWAKSCLKDIS